MPSRYATSERVPSGHCVPEKTVTFPFELTSTTAQDGPIRPCVLNGVLYVAENTFAELASVAPALPTLRSTTSCTVLEFRVAV